MTDLPQGAWSDVIVGHQWPSAASLATLSLAVNNRSNNSTQLEKYVNQLASARTGPLASQEGVTAEDARDTFHAGEKHAQELGRQNLEKLHAYVRAQNATSALRAELTSVADDGNAEIASIQSSTEPGPIKFGKIIEAVMRFQSEANIRAARHADTVRDAIQQIFIATGLDYAAYKFAQDQGFNSDQAFGSPSKEATEQAVSNKLQKGLEGKSSLAGQDIFKNSDTTPFRQAANANTSPNNGSGAASISNSETSGTVPQPPLRVEAAQDTISNADAPTPSQPRTPTIFVGPGAPSQGGIGIQPSLASAPGSIGQTGSPGVSAIPSTAGSLSALTPASAFTPEGLAQNFNTGVQAGSPMSAGTEALSNNAMHAMAPPAPLHSESFAPPPVAPTAPSSGMPLFENAHTAAPVEAPAVPPAEAPHTVVATPAAAPLMPSTPAAPPVSAGPLPAYGADLRPPAATIPAGPPPLPSATPGSAPLGPANTSALNQPAVVRQSPTPTPTATMAGLTENAFAATTAGASVGAAAAQTEARQRLQRLLDAVARQEPKLRWAIGDRADGTTVLTTDLASGWIPPHIDIPTGITLLPPEHRRPDLTAMLGETTLIAAHSPGQYIPAAEDAEPVSTSIRARRTADVDDLGWELAQATKWRDGLPRLAHTLAKAVSTGTGYLDSEVDLLREHLAAVTPQTLTDYPDNVDPAKVGNWQLLATIDALINNEKTSANYHLAWFQTLNSAVRGEAHR